jgi:hypothetical protein
VQPRRAVKSFLRTRWGFLVLLALAIGTIVLTYTYVGGILLAIVAILVFGLAVPIWVGVSRPRTLAIMGIVILLVSAPLIALVTTSEVLTPPGTASSPTVTLPSGRSGSVLQNATVSPFVSEPPSTFTWTVSIFPIYVPPNSSRALWIDVFISTCLGATGPNSPNCASGYPFYVVNHTLSGGLTNGTVVPLQYTLNGDYIWSWQMGIAYYNKTGNLTWTFLVGDPTYNGLEGPITGDYWSTYGLLIFNVFEAVLFYLGLVFFIGLLLYMVLKNRKRRQQEQRARANPPPPVASASTSAPPPSAPPALAPIAEAACPNCSAVVYPGEKVCWKCGTRLSSPPSSGDSPLPSAPKG